MVWQNYIEPYLKLKQELSAGLSIAGGVIAGYEKYSSVACLSNFIVSRFINAGISIGSMHTSITITMAAMEIATASSLVISRGVIIAWGVIITATAGIQSTTCSLN